jgi:hypothetical protein
VLNTIAVASAMAAWAGFVLGMPSTILLPWMPRLPVGGAVAFSTFVAGLLSARMLRSPLRLTRWKIQIGWVMSPVFAALSAALTGAVLALFKPDRTVVGKLMSTVPSAISGATDGIVLWLPALLVTLLCFGVPITLAQRLSARGLAGKEQGERVVGLFTATLGVLCALSLKNEFYYETVQRMLVTGLSLTAIGTGTCAALLSTVRAMRRRAFVAQAEAGRMPGYRVDTAPEGKVLMRVATSGEVYRGSERFEAVVELDHKGAAKRALVP